MQNQVGVMWKIAATSLALIPGLYGIIFFMVSAATKSLDVRIDYLEKEMAKGGRFTEFDGTRLRDDMSSLFGRHDRDTEATRLVYEKIRFVDATLKATQQSLLLRFARVEEKVYAADTKRNSDDFLNTPYKLGPNDDPWWIQADWQKANKKVFGDEN